MTIEELMETASDGNQWVGKAWTEEELLEACRYSPGKGQPYDIQRLFSVAKAIHDPSPEVKERQEEMRKKGIPEKDVIAFSALLEEKHTTRSTASSSASTSLGSPFSSLSTAGKKAW